MRYFIILCLAFVFVSCTTGIYNTYHSTSALPNRINSVFTNFYLIPWSNSDYVNMGILACVDQTSLTSETKSYYILFAPSKSTSANNIDILNLTDAVPLNPIEAKTLLNSLANVRDAWFNPVTDTTAIFFEFTSTPSYEQYQISDSTVLQYPSFRFHFENTDDGSTAYIYLGPKNNVHFISVRNKASLISFYNTLSQAIKHLSSLGYQN